jgi:hypothetical protein
MEIIGSLETLLQAECGCPPGLFAKKGGINHPPVGPDVEGSVAGETWHGGPEAGNGVHDARETFYKKVGQWKRNTSAFADPCCCVDELDICNGIFCGDVERAR